MKAANEYKIERQELIDYLSANKSYLEQKYHLTKIGFFGSIARGEQNLQSDIDLLVEFKENTPGLYELKQDLKLEIQAVFNKTVDICREKYIKPIFKKQILSEATYV